MIAIRSLVLAVWTSGLLLSSCVERPGSGEVTPDNTFPGTVLPVQDTSALADTVPADSVPAGAPIPIYP